MSQAAAVSATLGAFAALPPAELEMLVGDMEAVVTDSDGNDVTVGDMATPLLEQIIDAVMTEAGATGFSENQDIMDAMTLSIVNANTLVGRVNATEAMSDEARAAALITQNDLVTEFKAVGRMDPEAAPTDIAAKLNASFANVEDIKTNFQDVYKEQIAAQSESGGGIITAVDDITVLVGDGSGGTEPALISVADIIGNDRNTGEGELRLISIGPAKVTYSEIAG